VPLNVVLVEPEIPQNTGAIGRLCVGLGATLHLVRPLGFNLASRQVRRCGLDYWEHLDLRVHDSWDAFRAAERPGAGDLHFLSRHAERSLYAARFATGAWLVFGNESAGLAPLYHQRYADRMFRIPMPGPHARSLNLANAVAVAAYEAYRQIEAAG
jgi:tRNA (cytidine/uridine-2'-O-)-methyltransferase